MVKWVVEGTGGPGRPASNVQACPACVTALMLAAVVKVVKVEMAVVHAPYAARGMRTRGGLPGAGSA